MLSKVVTERSSTWAVFGVFLRLGLTSFGGPIAHLGYFRTAFVERRRWLSERDYADLVALCQFLPGPTSSQVGMAIGAMRAGWLGSVAAWLGFTLPSALLLMTLAFAIRRYPHLSSNAAVHGLKIAAVAIVAQAVWQMGKRWCNDGARVAIALVASGLTLAWPGSGGQVAAIAAAGVAGIMLKNVPPATPTPHACGISMRAGAIALALLATLLVALPLAAQGLGQATLIQVDGFFRAGAFVFGGGHVVLPLLQANVVATGTVSAADFLAGYGAAQAAPGPLFSLAAYLGAIATTPPSGWAGGVIALVAIFAPGYLLVMGVLPFWSALQRLRRVRLAMAGANAAVVGILLSALYDPLWLGAIHADTDIALAVVAFALLTAARWSPLLVVMATALARSLIAI